MLIGQSKLIKTFKNLVDNDNISHGYICFGEPQTGKYSFALALASFLEGMEFDIPELTDERLPKILLRETVIIRPGDNGSIGIDKTRIMSEFLMKKPVYSKFRIAIIDDANRLTMEAQSAILKITEEPPRSSLIILVLPYPEVILPTLQSRFQKIYFPRLNNETIARLVSDRFNVSGDKAMQVASISFGRPGRAIDLMSRDDVKRARDDVIALLNRKKEKKIFIKTLVENQTKLDLFFMDFIAELAKDPLKNYDVLKLATIRLTNISSLNTNKRLQLESILWNI